jgi:hypothetical protein
MGLPPVISAVKILNYIHIYIPLTLSRILEGVAKVFYDIHGRKREVLFFYSVPIFVKCLGESSALTPMTDCGQNAMGFPSVYIL